MKLEAAIRCALEPIGRHPMAAAVLSDLDTAGEVSERTLARLLAGDYFASSGQAVLLDLVKVLLDYGADVAPVAHPARAMYLGDTYGRAYARALATVWEDQR